MNQALAVSNASDPVVRRSGLGSSDAPIVANLSTYRDRASLYLEKRGLIPQQPAGEAAEWGRIMEPVILRQYAIRQQVHVLGRDDRNRVSLWTPDGEHLTEGLQEVHADPYVTHVTATGYTIPGHVVAWLAGTMRHPERPWQMFHADGFALNERGMPIELIEAKTASAYMARDWGEAESDEVPAPYLVQAQHGLDVACALLDQELPMAVPALLGGNRWGVFRIAYSAQLVIDLVQLETAFWESVQNGEQPDPAPDLRGLDTLKLLYPEERKGSELIVANGSELHALAQQLAAVKRDAAHAEEREAALKVAIQERMQDVGKLAGDGWSITWRRSKDSEYTDHAQLATALAGRLAKLDPESQTFIEQATRAAQRVKSGSRAFRPNLSKL